MFSFSVRQRNKMLSLKSHYLACVLECVKNTDVKLHGCKFECVEEKKHEPAFGFVPFIVFLMIRKYETYSKRI